MKDVWLVKCITNNWINLQFDACTAENAPELSVESDMRPILFSENATDSANLFTPSPLSLPQPSSIKSTVISPVYDTKCEGKSRSMLRHNFQQSLELFLV